MRDLDKAYQETLDYLYSFVDYSLTKNFRFTPEKFNLGRMEALLALLGNPHRQYAVIHVAGTKGKGSISAMVASALRACGYRTGFYTSPHLVEYTERISVDGQLIAREDLIQLVEEMRPFIAAVPELTTFEITTALAFWYFARVGVKAAVIEVGLGGRLDATNVVEPLVSVISSLSYDHMNVLGNTLTQIATEKCGIIKPGRPVVLSPQKDEAQQVVKAVAQERGSALIQVGQDYFYSSGKHALDGQVLWVWKADDQAQMDDYIENKCQTGWQPAELSIPLLGFHQVENAATAYAALQVAREQGLVLPEEAIKRGFRDIFWPCRFEILRRTPPVVIDSAHNRDSALKLRLTIEDYLPGRPVVLLFGVSEDKDVFGMFTELLPRTREVIATQSIHPRAMKAEEIVSLAHRFGRPARVVLPVERALEEALAVAGEDAALVVAGSLFVAAAAREAWQELGNTLVDFKEAPAVFAAPLK